MEGASRLAARGARDYATMRCAALTHDDDYYTTSKIMRSMIHEVVLHMRLVSDGAEAVLLLVASLAAG